MHAQISQPQEEAEQSVESVEVEKGERRKEGGRKGERACPKPGFTVVRSRKSD